MFSGLAIIFMTPPDGISLLCRKASQHNTRGQWDMNLMDADNPMALPIKSMHSIVIFNMLQICCDVPQSQRGGECDGGRGRDGNVLTGRLAEALTRITLGAGVSDLNKSLFDSLVLAGTE